MAPVKNKHIPMGVRKMAGGMKNKQILKFYIECETPVEDGFMNVSHFEVFLNERIKVNGKVGQMAANGVNIELQKTNLILTAEVPFSKRYLKYLTNTFLRKNSLRDWLRVVASSKDTYELRYFQLVPNSARGISLGCLYRHRCSRRRPYKNYRDVREQILPSWHILRYTSNNTSCVKPPCRPLAMCLPESINGCKGHPKCPAGEVCVEHRTSCINRSCKKEAKCAREGTCEALECPPSQHCVADPKPKCVKN
uniref:Large ribosomal subunit protein eL22 n=1 Tax=Ascaris suum TaxID=6253 RepID=F1LE03_ASCSU